MRRKVAIIWTPYVSFCRFVWNEFSLNVRFYWDVDSIKHLLSLVSANYQSCSLLIYELFKKYISASYALKIKISFSI